MSQDEILNYDPSRRSPNETLIEYQKIVFYDNNKAPILSVYVPASALANKTDQEIGRYVHQVFLAHNVDVSWMELDDNNAERLSKAIANAFAHYYARCMVVNLMVIYSKRIVRGDGVDPEIEIVDKAESSNQSQETVERELAAVARIVDHLLSKTETGIAKVIVERRDIITEFWRTYFRNLGAHTLLLIGEKNPGIFSASQDEFTAEFVSVGNEHWRQTYNLTFELAGEQIASGVLQRLNPAGVPFQELKEMIRGGLDACLTLQDKDLVQLEKGIKKIVNTQGITFRVSGDGRSLSIELPKESGFPSFDRLVDHQDALIKYLLEPARRGPKPDLERQNRYKDFVASVNRKEDIARYLSSFAKKHVCSDWIKQLEFDYYYQDLCKEYDGSVIRQAEQQLNRYLTDRSLGISTHSHATSPLGVAQIITAIEMNLRNVNGSLLSINTLNQWYINGGGHRWKKSTVK